MSNPLDTKIISRLAEILDKTNLTELEYEDEGCRISLVRNHGAVMATTQFQPVQQVQTQAVQSVSVPSAEANDTQTGEVDYTNSPNAVKSPMVGVVYLSADPKSPNYVKVGDSVSEGDTVCLVEAMKTFNPVKAHKGGKVSPLPPHVCIN